LVKVYLKIIKIKTNGEKKIISNIFRYFVLYKSGIPYKYYNLLLSASYACNKIYALLVQIKKKLKESCFNLFTLTYILI